MKKTLIHKAVAAAITAACLVPATSFGITVDANTGAGSAVDAGDAILFPFYTTRGGKDGDVASTNFSVTNTANSVVAVKVRFREQKLSLDVLDFTAILSPHDKFDFWVTAGAGGRPRMGWNDNTCVIIPDTQVTKEGDILFAQFPPVANVTPDDEAVGHLEVFGLATLGDAGANQTTDAIVRTDPVRDGAYNAVNVASLLPVRSCVGASGMPDNQANCQAAKGAASMSLAAAAVHGTDGQPANCDLLKRFFGIPANVREANKRTAEAAAGGSLFFGDAPNSLMGRYVVSVNGRGVEAGSDPIVIRNSQITNDLHREAVTGNETSRVRYVTSQTNQPCFRAGEASTMNCRGYSIGAAADRNEGTNFTPNDASRYNWDFQDWGQPHLGTIPTTPAGDNAAPVVNRLANVQLFLETQGSLSGDWSTNPNNFVGVDWVISFPAKYVYLNRSAEAGCSADGRAAWCLSSTPWMDGNRGGLPVGVAGGWTTANRSPATCLASIGPRFWDKDEQEAFSFGVSPTGSTLTFCNEVNVLTMAPVGVNPIDSLIQKNADRKVVTFGGIDGNRGWAWMRVPVKDMTYGAVFTVRATDDPTQNNGSLTELKRGIRP